ncbi:MAG TPA: hypothetical protein PKI32_10340, partial [Opitutales bacterium]|nr:hypothetical protein [Opitutales bacterium]
RFLPIPQAPDASYRAKGFNHKSNVLAKGWNSEFFVPWSVFDEGAPKVYDQWNANVVHNKYGAKRETCGNSFTLGINGNREMFGILRFTGRGD